MPTHTLLLITRPSCSLLWYFILHVFVYATEESFVPVNSVLILFNFLTTDDSGVVTGSPFPSFANFCFFFSHFH